MRKHAGLFTKKTKHGKISIEVFQRMALITCSECGKSYSDKADACPSCGCPTSLQAPPKKRSPQESNTEINLSTPTDPINAIRPDSSDNKNTLRVGGILAILLGAILAFSTGLITGSNKTRYGAVDVYSRSEGEKLTANGFIAIGITSIVGGLVSLGASGLLANGGSDHTQTKEFGMHIPKKRGKKSQRTKKSRSKYDLYYDLLHIASNYTIIPGNMSLSESIISDDSFTFKTSDGKAICTFKKEESQIDQYWDTWTICTPDET